MSYAMFDGTFLWLNMVANLQKERISRAFRFRPLRSLLRIGVRLTVPKNRVGVALACINDLDEVFLVKHVYHPGTPWGLPGGWLERSEDPAGCALRELEEEVGLSAEIGRVIYISREHYPDHIGIAYLARIKSGNMRLSSEILEASFFARNRLPEPLTRFGLNVIDAALAANTNQMTTEFLSYE